MWRGVAHRAFVEQLRASAPSITATAERYEHYAGALNCYASVLDETAPLLVVTRNRLRQRYEDVAGRCPGTLGSAETTRPTAADLLPLASTFKAGYDRWADALDRCIAALSQADESDPTRDRHGFAAFGHHVAGVVGAALSPFERAVLHPSLANISACLGSLNLGLTALGVGLLFVCPAVGAACLTAATVLAVAQLAVDSARREQGEQVSAGNLGMDLAAAVPVGGGAVRGLRTAAKVTHLVPGGGLMVHEGLDGGHTLAKHVGKSEQFLRNRLATEPDLTAASTFYDRQTAESGISWTFKEHGVTLDRWLTGKVTTLILESTITRPVGVVIPRATGTLVHASGMRVIVKRSPLMVTGFRIHTAMVIE
ncbi:RNase A-like domain-containing protein [Jatrophihabitans sp.]|uniref:RNase A-like domain-containing protein n=1 Tax=Jatrophihabitans sp. TaxID=1932789 RepID=UPI002C4152E4|nr:RNase A-like domain-containing protein [Jatrophihabitans sp.]